MNFWNETDPLKIELLVRKRHSYAISRRQQKVYWISPFPFVIFFLGAKPDQVFSSEPSNVFWSNFSEQADGVLFSEVTGLDTGRTFRVHYFEKMQSFDIEFVGGPSDFPAEGEVTKWKDLRAVRLTPLCKKMIF